MYGRNTRGFPGMFAPMYQLSAVGYRVWLATSWTCLLHAVAASSIASIVVAPRARAKHSSSSIHSTCCSIATGTLVTTPGLPGPVIVKRFGNPGTLRPRYVRGPSGHASGSVAPPVPRTPSLVSAPVRASNPVAYTITSSSCSDEAVLMPRTVIASIGSARRSTSRTFGRLNVS